MENQENTTIVTENKFFKWITPLLITFVTALLMFIFTGSNQDNLQRYNKMQNEIEKHDQELSNHQKEIANLFANLTIFNDNIKAVCRAVNTHCTDTIPLLPDLSLLK